MMTRRLSRLFALDTFDEMLSCVAFLGMVVHGILIFMLFKFSPDLYTERMGNYPMRGLDFLWWMLWFLGVFVCAHSDMFKYQRYAWGVATGLVGSMLSLLPTIMWGLGDIYSVALLGGSFVLIGACIALNRFPLKKPS